MALLLRKVCIPCYRFRPWFLINYIYIYIYIPFLIKHTTPTQWCSCRTKDRNGCRQANEDEPMSYTTINKKAGESSGYAPMKASTSKKQAKFWPTKTPQRPAKGPHAKTPSHRSSRRRNGASMAVACSNSSLPSTCLTYVGPAIQRRRSGGGAP